MDSLVEFALEENLFYGAEVLVAQRDGVRLHKAYGTFDGVRPLVENAVFDVASLSKPVATASLLLALGLPLGRKVSAYIPAFSGGGKEDVTLGQLAAHTAGFAPTTRFIETCRTPEEVFEALLQQPLSGKPGSRVVYSCLGYMLLGKVIEIAAGKDLNRLFHEMIAARLDMHDSTFLPHSHGIDPARLVPTGTRPHNRGKPGIVHDSNAFVSGGISGNAGLFSTVRDLHRFALMLLDKTPLFPPDPMFGHFTPAGQTPRTIGWELKRPGVVPSCGSDFPDGAIGHTGFTGTSIWIDRKSGLIAILLSNRSAVSHDRTREAMGEFRHRFHRLAARDVLGAQIEK